MKGSFLAAACLGVVMALVTVGSVRAAELRVLAGGGMTNELGALGPVFERATGHKVSFVFAATPELIRLATSSPFDAAVVPAEVYLNDAARAKFAAGSVVDVARVGFGVAVKAGASRPDIATEDAFKQAMLGAQSVALLPGSAAGAAVLKVFDRLGIAEVMKAKTKAQSSTGAIGAAVAQGDAELGVFLINVLVVPGVDLVGPFPGGLQSDFVFRGGVAADSAQGAAAAAFIDFLRTPEAAALIRAKGMTAG
jgi:molybdate transport system substrate-binding protein